MSNYKLTEMFYSLQGEGHNIGHAALFIRFSGCTLNCTFCDTDFTQKFELSLEEIKAEIKAMQLPNETLVILTGGEPLLQVDMPLVRMIENLGLLPCIETSGDEKAVAKATSKGIEVETVLHTLHDVTISPKNSYVSNFVLALSSAIKILVPFPGDITEDDVRHYAEELGEDRNGSFPEFILQPITTKDLKIDPRASALAMRFQHKWVSQTNKDWRVIPQCHVPMQLR
jgi:organic radical activating enzyme